MIVGEMKEIIVRTLGLSLAAGLALSLNACGEPQKAAAAPDPVKRGEYLVKVMVCTDCHTPGHFLGKPDEKQFLAGSDVGFFIPGLGYFYGRNLTPDDETGLGRWTNADIVKALRTGVRPDGRVLSPNMPWQSFANLTDEDANAIAAYLKSLKPIRREAPAVTGPDQTAPAAFLAVTPPSPPATTAAVTPAAAPVEATQ